MASRICSAASAQASHLGEAVSLEAFRHPPVSGATPSSHRECCGSPLPTLSRARTQTGRSKCTSEVVSSTSV
ncbi:hypothetical protein HMPREF9601_02659 [Cutibacterium acnes HL030PA1]|nr:hypothetical protein HMPREF9577_01509 [Cutibacterium acnes HL110PA3]EFT79649.1 hypothetical protein HMPREF9601_02659 [Cutibacterium acnes HL030PA1]MCW5115028.1 hypothetical protein [Cutibacterium acnes P05]